MARVEERTHIHRPVAAVWDLLVRWEHQPEWMQDARSVTVTSPQREGVGVTISVPTDIAFGIVVTDVMEVTRWDPQQRIDVRHTGRVIRGHGAFELHPTRLPDGGEGTLFTWWEEVDAPLGRLGDRAAQLLVMPWVSRVFRRSLRALKAHAEATIPAA